MAIGVTSYPAALDTADTLIRAQNNCPQTTTTDTGGVGANSTTGTTIAVATTTGYPASGTITIDSEIITYAGLTGTTFTGCTRGVDGTTAAAHALGAPVNGFETALHHNVLVNALIAVETALGTASSGIPQQAWTAPTLQNAFTNLGGGTQPAGYFKDTQGVVHLRGVVTHAAGLTASTLTPIFTLPVGYRPAATCIYAVSGTTAFGELRVGSDGTVNWYAGSTGYFTLDGVTFDTR